MKHYYPRLNTNLSVSSDSPDTSVSERGMAKEYWYGLVIPIILGLGSSLFSLIVLLNADKSSFTFVIFFATFFHLGHILLWPVSAVFLKNAGGEVGNFPYRNGASLSLKLYAIWMIVIVAPVAWLASTFNGIV